MINALVQFAAEKEGLAVLGIDPKAIVLQAGTFVLLFLVVRKVALPGIIDTLEKRRLTIDQGVELGLEMKQAKEQLDSKVKEIQREARLEADKIIAKAHGEATKIIEAGEATAITKADAILDEAELRIEQEMQAARKQLHQEMLALVSEATEVIIDAKVDAKKDAYLIERALGKVRG